MRERSNRAKTEERNGSADASALDTTAPARNFTIPLEARVRALGGPPAYSIRRRRIEDLEAEIVTALREEIARAEDARRAKDVLANHLGLHRRIARLAELVHAHNRYYPVEANLPIDPLTGLLLERGKRWEPLAAPTFEALFARAVLSSE